MPKADRIEHDKRVLRVRSLVLSGMHSKEIVQAITAPALPNGAGGFGVNERQGWNYIRAAREMIQKDAEPLKEEALYEHIAVRRLIRARAMGDGDFRTALASAQDEAKLFNLYPVVTSKAEIGGLDGGPVQVSQVGALSDDELHALAAIAALIVAETSTDDKAKSNRPRARNKARTGKEAAD